MTQNWLFMGYVGVVVVYMVYKKITTKRKKVIGIKPKELKTIKARSAIKPFDFDVGDWLALKSMNINVVSNVVGACHYHLGKTMANVAKSEYKKNGRPAKKLLDLDLLPQIRDYPSTDLHEIEEQVIKTIELALERLREEARKKNAHAVVDVKIKSSLTRVKSNHIEYIAVGTAVTLPEALQQTDIIVTTLSAKEFVSLASVGTIAKDIVFACSYLYRATFISEPRKTLYSKTQYKLKNSVKHNHANGVINLKTYYAGHVIDISDKNQVYVYETVIYGDAVLKQNAQNAIQPKSIKPILQLS